MPMINNRKRLIEKLEKLRLFEKKASEMYSVFLKNIENQKDREDILSVVEDEIKHEKMVGVLIKMAKSN